MEPTRTKVLVIGAGAGGLAAASWLKQKGIDFIVVEGGPNLPLNLHNGVHYLHDRPELPFDTDIREITLTDGVLEENGQIAHKPTLNHALQYSEKVREIQHPSSIFEIGKRDSVFMPTSNSLNSLLQEMHDYVGPKHFYFSSVVTDIDVENKIATISGWDSKDKQRIQYDSIISTAPLDKMAGLFKLEPMKLEAHPVNILNYKVEKIVPNWMINLYVPDLATPMYRASILNGVLSVELTREADEQEARYGIPALLSMFHIADSVPEKYNWATGKVMSMSIDAREKLVEALKSRDIYSIGRFGLWNRKLLVHSTIRQAKAVVDHISGSWMWEATRGILIK